MYCSGGSVQSDNAHSISVYTVILVNGPYKKGHLEGLWQQAGVTGGSRQGRSSELGGSQGATAGRL